MLNEVELSAKQREIVFSPNTAILVKASAGSGKTRVLTERIRHLLKQTNKKVLALTFTNKAGSEIKDRLSDIDNIESRTFIGTFHGFCQSVLENHGSLIGLSTMPHIFEDETDRLELVEEAISMTPSYESNYRSQSNKEQKAFRYRVLEYVSQVKRELIDDGQKLGLHTDDENIVLLYQNYQDILHNQNAIDFDDLLLKVHSLFFRFPKIASLYRRSFYAICIDEAQDLNNSQYQVLLALTGNKYDSVMMVGDSNQSIYHFNGSSPTYMTDRFVKDYSAKITNLSENYRSSYFVLSAANKLIPETKDTSGVVKQGIFEINAYPNEFNESEAVIEKINKLIDSKYHSDIEGQICYEKIAILARNKYVFNQIEVELEKQGIPYYFKMTPGSLRFESEIMKTFDLALRVKLNPQDRLHKMRLIERCGSKAEADCSLEQISKEVTPTELRDILGLILSVSDDGSNLKRLLVDFRDSLAIADENEKNMVFNDINELIKHWLNYAKKTDNKSLHQFKNAMALGQTHSLTEHTGITLSTVHTMKGQEFDIVFVIGLDDETFPDYRAVRNKGIELIQEKNNLYVAFTRAKRFLFLSYPQQRTMPWGGVKNRKYSRFLQVFC
ncbi:ATP-dependent helicase [Marinomonas lutimaris]|uniref:ATP-dependent helicase n=1 Tax=Marinomonas lutimaris TaxID=2846746 RepID=UPI001C66A926|nr:ATP-dependent helicase [Marinomonas lutimaris]